MTRADFTLLQTTDSKAIIERYINQDSLAAALKIGVPAISSQIKYLSKAASKLPHHYAARCIIDDIGYEQCSSQTAAFSKFDGLSGALAVDLTCGLGVDSYALSKCFERVISIEANELKADIARYNFAQLGATNIEVISGLAEDFCKLNGELKVDLIYVDPSRVADGKRVFSIVDSSPDIFAILPALKRMSDKIIIKLSPMFDIDECFRLFDGCEVEVVSIRNECKEVLVRIGCGGENNIKCTIINNSSTNHYVCSPKVEIIDTNADFEPEFVYVPDVVFYKTRTLNSYVSANYSYQNRRIDNYVFSTNPLDNFAGQCFKIDYITPYNPKKIKALGIKKSTLHIRNFPYSLDKVLKQLNIKQGGDKHILLTTYRGAPTLILASGCADCGEK